MNKILIISLMMMLLSVSIVSAYEMSEGVIEQQQIVNDFVVKFLSSNFSKGNLISLLYGMLSTIIVQDGLIQELEKRPESCSCGGGNPQIITETIEVCNEEPEEGSIQGDLNGDGVVDIVDLNIILICFSKDVVDCEYPEADVNSDGVINNIDKEYVLENYS